MRLQLAGSVGRSVSTTLTAGVSSRFLRFTRPAPRIAPSASAGAAALRLYWDPSASISVGPYLQMIQPLGARWSLTGRARPGVAYLRERDRAAEFVPDLSARLGFLFESEGYRGRIEAFFGQGRFSAYRSYGIDVSLGARGLLGSGPGS